MPSLSIRRALLFAHVVPLLPVAAQGPVVAIPDAATQYRDTGPTHVAAGDGILHVGAKTAAGFDYARSTDQGRTWRGVQLFPYVHGENYELQVSGQHVYAVATVHPGARCRTSIDGGRTWLPPVAVPSYAPSGGSDNGVVVAAQGPVVAVVSGTIQLSNQTMFLTTSVDGGATWRPRVLLTGPLLQTKVIVDGLRLHVMRPDSGTLAVDSSSDQGQSWSGRRSIPRGAPFSLRSFGFRASGNNLVAAFTLDDDSAWASRSTDGGATWLATPVALGAAQELAFGFDGGFDCAAVSRLGGPVTLFASHDAGATWSGHATPLSGSPLLATDAGSVLLATYTGTPLRANATLSRDGGRTWSTVGTQPCPCGSGTFVTYPSRLSLHLFGTRAFLAQEVEACNFGGSCSWHGMAFLSTADAGASWHAITPRAGHVGHPVVVPTDHGFSVVVGHGAASFSSGPTPVSCSLLVGHQPYGVAKPGSGSTAPALRATGEPFLGHTMAWTIERALGGALALFALSFHGAASIPFGSGLVLVQPPILIAGDGITSGQTGLPGVGTLTLSLPLPRFPGLRGTALNWQGFVLDPGAAESLASTAGLETWLQ